MTTWAAGILPIALDLSGAPVVLLGLDARSKGGKWSDFAGGGETQDAGCPRATALRELVEETGGALTMVLDDLHGALEFRDVTPSGKAMHRYVVPVAYDADLPHRFRGSKDDEKVAMGWFPLGALPPLRHVFMRQMRRDAPTIAKFATRHPYSMS